jgi:hypothetical protein
MFDPFRLTGRFSAFLLPRATLTAAHGNVSYKLTILLGLLPCKHGKGFLPVLASIFPFLFYVFIFAAARNFAERARGLETFSFSPAVTGCLVKRRKVAS